jgi:Kef-type K+ transport system membrane component KefB
VLLGVWIATLYGYEPLQAAFIGMALSTTAISVTAKIFRDFKFSGSNIAHQVMGAAIMSDIAAFIMLSIILAIAEKGAIQPSEVFLLVGEVALFFGGIILAGTKLIPISQKVFESKGFKAFTFTLVIAFAFGWFAEYIGLHYILGAYLAGLFVKEEVIHPEVYRKIEDRLFGLSYSFLGPIFFISLGFHVDFAIFQDPRIVGFFILITLAAIIGKFIGAGGLARLLGAPRQDALLVGISMNGRGAVELIIALIGLEIGLIDASLFSVLVFMAFTATLIMPLALKYMLRCMGKRELLDT